MATVHPQRFICIFLLFLLFMLSGKGVLKAQVRLSLLRTEVRYDANANLYIVEEKMGAVVISTLYTMTPKEYVAYRLRELQAGYFRNRNVLATDSLPPPRLFTLSGLRNRRDPLTTIFGPGGVQLTPQGSIEIVAGLKRDVTDNPTLPQRARRRSIFDFDQQIQLNLNAKVGDKVNFDINYDTEATFDFRSKQINLAYRGDEDEIIRNVEAGNVSMTTDNRLINGGAALFGIKADLQLGKLKVNTLFSQQQSEARTVNSSGGTQTTPFEFSADSYDENRHFFLGFWFRERYDEALSKLPYVQSPLSITRMEVWVTNKRGDYDQARNIVAFADMGEQRTIHNHRWQPQGSTALPYNRANTLYDQLTTTFAAARTISEAARILPGDVINGVDYEKLESARLLSTTEYTWQPQLGYLSLSMPLQADEVLAVAFEYTYNGEVYQVGEFASDVGEGSQGGTIQNGALFLRLLKPVSLSPAAPTWHLMMKNIYSLGYGAYNLQEDRFLLNITRQSDTTGVYLNYLPDSKVEKELLLRVMQLDRLNNRDDPYPDGLFDFMEGYTIDARNGRLIFPVVEPFGSHLRSMLGNDPLAERYLFQELYDSTLTVARQIPERNKYRISGEYRGSTGAEINLNAMNIARGSVRVTAGGTPLTEGVDYTVDYLSGTVSILNRALLDAGTPISVSLEDQTLSQMQRKTLMGVNLQYDFSRNLSAGATLMHYYEKPLTTKSIYGDESAKNTLWGLNLRWESESYALTNLLDMLPFTEATQPSQLSADLAFAQMIAGHYSNKYTGSYSYLDDFDSSTSAIDLRTPYNWTLAATPYNNAPSALFPEAALTNNSDYGKNRALLSWFYIDGLFTRRNSDLTPTHIRNDPEQLSDHRVREIFEREIFPNRDALYGMPATIPVLNLSYYPNERGPYNLDSRVDSEGSLLNPHQRWGGITRRMETRDFEAANIEYIEFWLMNPFANDTLGTSRGGDLYVNLGEISEDVLKDGKKFFENGMPVDGDTTATGRTVWGKYPRRQSTVYGFNNAMGMDSRRLQDVGLNGLSSEEEKLFPTYAAYLGELQQRLSGETLTRMQDDNYSPLNDPAGDSFRHYRGEEQDRQQLTILERYKYFNGTEGNSMAPENEDGYHSASRTTPDVEDIDNDNTLNENESYYQYKVSLRPESMEPGSNFITDRREVSVKLRNGREDNITWYQFRIPLSEYQLKVGNIEGFNNIRFMRLFLTAFNEPLFLRFATLELVRSEWRSYRNDLLSGGALAGMGKLEITAVNIEENGSRTPVNYVLPPGVTRILDPSQPQLRQENEQALSLKVTDLDPGDVRSVYKSTMQDLRRYKRLQMFVHAERLPDDPGELQEGDLSIFLRMGSDYRNNYYEYEIPLQLTPEGHYSTHIPGDRLQVWPEENMFDFPLELLTSLKLLRNEEKREGGAAYFTPFSREDPDKPENRITIMGNPSLAEVKVMMIGIRNHTTGNRSGEVWVNEMRLSGFDEQGGWAAQGNLRVALSDIGTVSLSGRKETAGFGALDQGLQQRRNDDYTSLHLSLNMELGRFLPTQAKITAPFYYSYSSERSAPLYDPFNRDLLLDESMEQLPLPSERDSARLIALTRTTRKSLSLNNVKSNIRSGSPMPYDPANFSFGYRSNVSSHHSPDTEYATIKDFRLQADYSYSPAVESWDPFQNRRKSGWTKLLQSLKINYLPDNIAIHSNLIRNYGETQLRDLNALAQGITGTQRHYLSYSRNFFWERELQITWNLTGNMRSSFRTGTVAEIEEPYLQVNKEINRSDYEVWKDSVMISLRDLGKPLNYEQTADVTYTLPFAQIPLLDWVTSSAAYNARYRWERGALISDETIGNILQNDLSLTLNSRFNLVSLYNKIPILQQVNSRFNSGVSTPQGDPSTRHAGTEMVHYIARAVMMLRQLNLNIGYKTRTDLPGYEPMIGDLFGQQRSPAGLLPGLGFAFGLEGGERFIRESLAHNRLVINPHNIRPALWNKTANLRLDATLEPFPGIRIALNALYEENQRTAYQYMVEGMPEIRGGSFAMSILSIRSAFERGRADNGYHSPAFERFRSNRGVIATRVRAAYSETHYPSGGFLKGSSLSGQPFSPTTGDVGIHTAEVLIPSFLAAYSGSDAGTIALTPFPALAAMLPNWELSLNMVTIAPLLQQPFQSFMISHSYISQYRVGSFSSHLSWIPLNDGSDLGFIRDVVSGAPLPSSPFDIATVSIMESFNPLVELRGTLHNNMNLTFRINRTRALNLNISSRQIVEMNDNDFVLGMGYRIAHFNRIIGFGSNTIEKRSRSTTRERDSEMVGTLPPTTTFNNDLQLRVDLSTKQTEALIRKIEEGLTQATSGISTTTLRFTADYAMSRALTLRAFFDKIINKPLVSSTAYPTANTSAGISVRFNFN